MRPDRLGPYVDTLTGRELEVLMAEFWSRCGWQTDLTQETNDGGIDVYLEHSAVTERIGVDTKRWNTDWCAPSDIADWYTGLAPDRAVDICCLATTTKFSSAAKRKAREYGIDLIGLRSLRAALGDRDRELCAQHANGNARPRTKRELSARASAIGGFGFTDDAKQALLQSPIRDELLYLFETMPADDRPAVVTVNHIEEYTPIVTTVDRPPGYPLPGSDSYLVASHTQGLQPMHGD